MNDQDDQRTRGRLSTIKEVRSPLGLLVLIVLAVEGLLLYLATQAQGTDLTILVVGMLGVLGSVIYVVFRRPGDLGGQSPRTISRPEPKFDVFLSVPMAAHSNDADYKADRERAIAIAKTLSVECKFETIYYAGENIASQTEFDAADISAKDDIDAITKSKYFILLFPSRLVSSVLVEAGAALALGIPSLYFVSSRQDLPFLLKQAEQAFPNVKIYELAATDQICALITKHRNELLPVSQT